MNAALWAAQIILFAGFAVGAGMKLLMPIARLSAIWPWTGALSTPVVRGIGVIDLAGGVGVVLPMLTGVRPGLTVAAAIGCTLLQLCAIVFHLARRERSAIPVNIVLLAMAVFIAWGRWSLL